MVTAIVTGILASACASSKSDSADAAIGLAAAASKASPLDAPPAAIQVPEAPGLNVEDLGARLREAVGNASGVDVVDEASVRRELASCEEAPCPEVLADKYRNAAFVVASSVSKIGSTFLATVRIQRGATEIARVNSQAPDARVAVATAGTEAGAKLRAKLLADGVAERVAAPPTDAEPEHFERDQKEETP